MNLSQLLPLTAACGLIFAVSGTRAQETSPAKDALVHRLTLEEYEATLRHWKGKYPHTITLERRGLSAASLPVYLVKITDSTVPDADKQICLVTALHSGPERLGTLGSLAVMEWILGDSPEADATRKRQIVLFMPVVNPLALFYTDRFRNDRGTDPYTGLGRVGKIWDVKNLKVAKPEDAPELMAVLSVMDQYQPEVHVDLHGTGMQEYSAEQLGSRRMYRGQMMTEVTGAAYSNYALRPWDWRVTEAMITAGREAGFPSDRFEADAQRSLWGPELSPLGKKLWNGMPLFYTAHYGYAKYHTMMAALEVAWEESAVARLKGLFRIGNDVWMDERTTGYPVNRLKSFVGTFVTAYGDTASARRRSRVELWSRQENFSLGFLYPQTVGRASLVCAVDPASRKIVAAPDLATLKQGLRERFGPNAAAIEAFVDAGPEIKLAMDTPAALLTAGAETPAAAPLEHGIGFRLRLPCRQPAPLVVKVNGEVLKESATDGYESWFVDGFTQVQVNMPPDRARHTGLFVVTCSYPPEIIRHTGWMPPREVMEQCQTAKADATPPTLTDASYGTHFRQTLDLWKAPSAHPTPLVVYIHGGGWAAEDKSNIHQHLNVSAFLEAGVSVAAINYRFIQEATAAGVKPPLQWPLEDAQRALQFLRSHALEWNLDKSRIAATGVSAGGCASLWLAMHDDMAVPDSDDAVARESTRLLCVAAVAPQTSLDPQQQKEWIPNSVYGGHAFGFPGGTRAEAFPPFLEARDSILTDIRRYSPYEHASPDDPPVFMAFPRQDKPPVAGEPQTDPTHSAVHGLMLQKRLQSLGGKVELTYPGAPSTENATPQSFLIHRLRAPLK